MTTANDPFAPPSAGPHPRSRTGRPTRRALVVFVVRRLIALFVLPALVAMLFAVVGLGLAEVAWWIPLASGALTGLLFVPTTLVYAWARFLSPREDPRAIVLMTGERFDRAAYRWFVRAGLVDRALGTVLLAAMAVGLLAVGLLPGLLALPLLVGGGAFNVYRAWLGWHAAEAVIAHAAGDADGVLAHTGRMMNAWIGASARDTLRQVRAWAYLRQGDPDRALAELALIRWPRRVHADHLRAAILVGRGELEPAKVIVARPHASVGERIGVETLAALLALYGGDPAGVIERSKTWDSLYDELPADLAGGFHLWIAAAHGMRGDNDAAALEIARSGLDLAERGWMAAVWPPVWAAISRATPR